MKLIIYNGKIITPKGILGKDHFLLIEKGKIVQISKVEENLDKIKNAFLLNAEGNYIAPGFIDLHTQGLLGYSTWETTYSNLNNISKHLLEFGVTGFLATTHATVEIAEGLAEIASKGLSGAELLGIYFEGPFINPKKKGGFIASFIKEPNIAHLKDLISASGGYLKMMTIAPELPNALRLIDILRQEDIKVALGHSEATYEQALKAVRHGASHITHLFNCMSPMHHRAPGLVTAALTIESLTCEIIPDGVHIHPAVILLAVKIKGTKKIAFVTDSSPYTGLPDGVYSWYGEEKVHLRKGKAFLKDGTLACSCLTLAQALKNGIKFIKLTLPELVEMLSLTPAKILGIANKKGSIEVGKDADLTIFSKKVEIMATIKGGKLVYKKF